jgi:ABC-type sugar transport system substrate-binding protein
MGIQEEIPRRRLGPVAVLLAIAILALSAGLAACGGDDDGNGDEGEARSVYLNAYAQEIPYFRDWQEGATARAEELGWEVSSEYGNTTPEQQVRQLESALVQQPDGILVTAIDEESIAPVLRQATEQGTSVVTVGGDVADEAARVSYVARDNVQLGRDKAQWVVDELDGEGKVGIVHGIPGLTFSEEQAEGYEEVLDEHADIEVVDGPFVGGFSADLGLDAAQALLTREPDLDAIIFDNDDLAQGGAEAARQRDADILILGTDGSDDALDSVEAGDLDYTISLCGYREGISAIDTLNTYFEEGEVEDRVVSQVEVFTTEDVADKRAELTREDCN